MNTTLINIWVRCLVILMCCLRPAHAKNDVPQRQIIAAAELSGLFHNTQLPEERGVYFAVLSKIINETGLSNSVEIIVMPMKRAKLGFINHKYACYSPGLGTFDSQAELELLGNVLVSQPLNKAIVRVVSASAKHIVHGSQEIGVNDLISMVRGTPLSQQMRDVADQARQLIFVKSELENIRMLQNGRVNHLFVFYPDAIFAYKKLGIKEHFPYATQFTPLVIDDTVICHEDFASIFNLINQKIQLYSRDGTLKRLLGDYYMLDSPYMDLTVD